MILYLTYNDQPSGVYWSQVTDVVEHLDALDQEGVRLVAMVSVRGFLRTRREIRERLADAIVLPMWPKARNWRKNVTLFAWMCRWLRPNGVICRGPFATWMALRMRDRGLTGRVCFDGRGAYAAEWEEYRIVDDDALIAQMRPLESEAVNASDFRIAVSHALVSHWRERYGYKGDAHVVIPCTLGRDFSGDMGPDTWHWRKLAGLENEGVVLAYSGSTARWQSFERVRQLLTDLLERDPRISVLFLSRPSKEITALKERFNGRIIQVWLKPEEVRDVLRECDHGLLVREPTLTNEVASPTKFAEYLSCGLPVIISDHLGDFTALVETHRLGTVVREDQPVGQLGRSALERQRMRAFALAHFTKEAHTAAYVRLMDALNA